MSNGSTTSSNAASLFSSSLREVYFQQFYIFIGLYIPSFICSIFDLYHLLRDRTLRRALHNHIIIVLLSINLFYLLTDILLIIYYFRNYETFTISPICRMLWGYLDWTFSYLQFVLYAWVTVQRHILVFHDHLVSTRRKRLFVHYLPPVVLTVYGLVYYVVVIFVVSCQNDFDAITYVGFIPCAYYRKGIRWYELVVQETLPIFIIILSSVVLLLRVMWQKYFVRRQMNWGRYGKMVIQVLSISLVYLVFPFPYIFVTVLYASGTITSISADYWRDTGDIFYYTDLVFPIVVLASSTELRGKLKKMVSFGRYGRQQNTVNPTPLVRANITNELVVIQ